MHTSLPTYWGSCPAYPATVHLDTHCMHVCLSAPRVCAKMSIPIMLKLRGSTILHSYHYCKPSVLRSALQGGAALAGMWLHMLKRRKHTTAPSPVNTPRCTRTHIACAAAEHTLHARMCARDVSEGICTVNRYATSCSVQLTQPKTTQVVQLGPTQPPNTHPGQNSEQLLNSLNLLKYETITITRA